MVLVWQTSDGYLWAIWFWTCSSVWFRSLRSNEGAERWQENGSLLGLSDYSEQLGMAQRAQESREDG